MVTFLHREFSRRRNDGSWEPIGCSFFLCRRLPSRTEGVGGTRARSQSLVVEVYYDFGRRNAQNDVRC